MACRWTTVGLGLAAAAGLAGCGGSDTVPFPTQDCCVAHVYYQCRTAQAAGMCLDPSLPDTRLCVRQDTPCPAGAAGAP